MSGKRWGERRGREGRHQLHTYETWCMVDVRQDWGWGGVGWGERHSLTYCLDASTFFCGVDMHSYIHRTSESIICVITKEYMFSNLGSIYNYGISMGLITSVSAMLHFLDDFTFADGTCILNFMYIRFKSTPNTIFSVKRQ